jgi:hypothetical protein
MISDGPSTSDEVQEMAQRIAQEVADYIIGGDDVLKMIGRSGLVRSLCCILDTHK